MNSAKRLTAGLMCFLLSTLPVLSEPQAAGQHAGQIDALIPAATRNDKAAKVKDELQWNDLLKTTRSGRVRAGLTDGSILSVGSDSELRVVQHDGASQQTSLELDYGKVRSQVQKITQPGGKFELKTPNAVIGVIGTDVYAAYASNKTTVICYSGKCSVTPLGKVVAIILNAGQMVVISSVIPPAGFQASDTPPGVQQSTMLATDVPESLPPIVAPGHAGRGSWTVFIGSAAAMGIAAGILSTRSNNIPCKVIIGTKANNCVQIVP